MGATDTTVETEAEAEVRNPEIPDHLICEICGIRPVDVIVTWLGSADNSRMCGADYLSTATSIVLQMAENADA